MSYCVWGDASQRVYRANHLHRRETGGRKAAKNEAPANTLLKRAVESPICTGFSQCLPTRATVWMKMQRGKVDT
jgi:hypothetical protein